MVTGHTTGRRRPRNNGATRGYGEKKMLAWRGRIAYSYCCEESLGKRSQPINAVDSIVTLIRGAGRLARTSGLTSPRLRGDAPPGLGWPSSPRRGAVCLVCPERLACSTFRAVGASAACDACPEQESTLGDTLNNACPACPENNACSEQEGTLSGTLNDACPVCPENNACSEQNSWQKHRGVKKNRVKFDTEGRVVYKSSVFQKPNVRPGFSLLKSQLGKITPSASGESDSLLQNFENHRSHTPRVRNFNSELLSYSHIAMYGHDYTIHYNITA